VAAVNRLDDKKIDAEELGRHRKTMRKGYCEWLEETNGPISKAMEFTAARGRALDLQSEIAALLKERYGFDIADRFLEADDADSQHPSVLVPTKENAGRIKRLRSIIRDIRSGKIRRTQHQQALGGPDGSTATKVKGDDDAMKLGDGRPVWDAGRSAGRGGDGHA
jgi:hypothetical protein